MSLENNPPQNDHFGMKIPYFQFVTHFGSDEVLSFLVKQNTPGGYIQASRFLEHGYKKRVSNSHYKYFSKVTIG